MLVNPLHAAEPVGAMEASPYLPTTRRFVNPLYIRVEDVRETAYLASTDRALIEWQAEALRATNTLDAELDRNAVWSAKNDALSNGFRRNRAHQHARPRSGPSASARGRAWSVSRPGAPSQSTWGCPPRAGPSRCASTSPTRWNG